MKYFSCVVAMDEKQGIGKGGTLAWQLSADLKHFKQVTTATGDPTKKNAVIMGRKTWDSLPEKFRPLPGRLNVVLTRQGQLSFSNAALSCGSLDEALSILCDRHDVESVFVIGGAQLYAQAIVHPACQGLVITQIKGVFDCDAFFPEIPNFFKPLQNENWLVENQISYRFLQFNRVGNS